MKRRVFCSMILVLCLSLLLTGCEFLDSLFSTVTPPSSQSDLSGTGTTGGGPASGPTEPSSTDPTEPSPTEPTAPAPTDPTDPASTSSTTKATTAADPTKEPSSSSSEKTTTSTKATTTTTKNTTTSTKATTTTTKATTTTTKATTTTTKATTTTTKATTTTTKPNTPQGSPLTPLAANQYYGYQYLKKQANSSTLLAAYQRLVDGVESCASPISMEGVSLSIDDLPFVMKCYRYDYPQHFWIDDSQGYSYSYLGQTISSVTLPYTMSGNALKNARADVENAVDSLLAGLTTANTQAEIVRTVHDRLVTLLAYDQTYSAPHTHDLYGALINHTSVCEGYAEAFHYAMYRAGIQCLSASGTGKGESHAWNVVRVDGKYYHIDVTWDDPVGASAGSPIVYGYYLLTDAAIQKDHVINQGNGYPLPACSSTAANFLYQASYTATMNADSMAQALAAQANAGIRNVFYLRMSDAPSSKTLFDFLSSNWDAIRKKANAQINGWTLPGYMGSYSGNVLALIPQ